jgi:hypothetical protein
VTVSPLDRARAMWFFGETSRNSLAGSARSWSLILPRWHTNSANERAPPGKAIITTRQRSEGKRRERLYVSMKGCGGNPTPRLEGCNHEIWRPYTTTTTKLGQVRQHALLQEEAGEILWHSPLPNLLSQCRGLCNTPIEMPSSFTGAPVSQTKPPSTRS